MLSILSTLVPVFGIILFGIVVERMGFLPIETSGCLNQFVYWIGLPMMLFNQLARMEAGQMSGAMVGGILLGYGITYLFAYVVFSSLLRRRWEESSVFALLSSFPNAAFMGLPIVVLLLPDSSEAAIVASLCAVMTSANLLFTDGRLEAGKHKGEGRKQVFLSLLRSLFHNPLLIYSALGAAVSLLHIAVPKPILSMSAMLGSTSAPCALFCMGMILSKQMTSSQGFVKGWARRQFPLHVLKLVVEPLFIFGVLYLLGVRGIALDADDYVVGAGIAAEGKQLLTVTENGYGKRTEIEEYLRLGEDGARHPQQRGGKGLKNYNLTAKTGLVAGVAIVEDGEDVMLVENGGVLIRMPVDSINIYKRDTQGVILMRLEEGGRVISLDPVEKEEEDADETSDAPQEVAADNGNDVKIDSVDDLL